MTTEAIGKGKHGKAWNIVLVISAIALGLLLSAKPWRVYMEQRAQARQYERDMHAAEQRRVDLTGTAAKLNSPLGKEQAAREAGLLKPGEQLVTKQ